MSDDIHVRIRATIPRPLMYALRKKYWEEPDESRLTHINLGKDDLAFFRSLESDFPIAAEIADEIEAEGYCEMWLSW